MAAPTSTGTITRRRAHQMYQELSVCYPDARCELDFDGPFQLLVATVLSAQTTDRRVNQVTPVLFGLWPDPAALARAAVADVEQVIRPLGFFHTKAAAIVGLSADLVERFDARVPGDLGSLVTLPGVGRKTANVVLGNAFGVPGITPDTHLMRVSRRMGWTTSTTPGGVETDVGALFDPDDWVMVCHRVIWHGRRRCHARRPACGACPVAALCPSFGEGPTDPGAAALLVREPRR